jgi:hypothetical protein
MRLREFGIIKLISCNSRYIAMVLREIVTVLQLIDVIYFLGWGLQSPWSPPPCRRCSGVWYANDPGAICSYLLRINFLPRKGIAERHDDMLLIPSPPSNPIFSQ